MYSLGVSFIVDRLLAHEKKVTLGDFYTFYTVKYIACLRVSLFIICENEKD